MAQDWARAFYHSAAWLSCRGSFIQSRLAADGGLCQDCQDRLGEIAHHWPVPLSAANVGDPSVALNHGNLRWVCRTCHDRYPGHGVAKASAPLLAFDANGDVIPPYPPGGSGPPGTAQLPLWNTQGVTRPPSEAEKGGGRNCL